MRHLLNRLTALSWLLIAHRVAWVLQYSWIFAACTGPSGCRAISLQPLYLQHHQIFCKFPRVMCRTGRRGFWSRRSRHRRMCHAALRWEATARCCWSSTRSGHARDQPSCACWAPKRPPRRCAPGCAPPTPRPGMPACEIHILHHILSRVVINHYIFIVTRFSCQKARCIYRQAAW